MKRGDIYWVNLNPTHGSEINKQRPCVLVGANAVNKARRTVVVVPLSTSAKPQLPLNVPVECLERKVVAVCDQIRAIDKTRLEKFAGSLIQKDLDAVENGLKSLLALS